jgi:dTMP kinase
MNEMGYFIVFESLDGGGSSTQIKNIAKALKSEGKDILVTAEPTDGPVGKLSRRYLSGALPRPPIGIRKPFMTMLMTADRLWHYHNEIAPNISKGTTVLCDRFYASTLAYQTDGLDRQQWIATLSSDIPMPDFQIYLRVNPEVGMARVEKRGGKKEFYETLQIQRGVYQNYENYFATLPRLQKFVVDGEKSPNQITDTILSEIKRRFF